MISVAIDGPAGAGKSTIARQAAKTPGSVDVDTGALYRSISLYMLRHQVDISDEAAVIAALPAVSVELVFQEGQQHVLLCGEDVSEAIRTPEVSMATSKVSAIGAVPFFFIKSAKGNGRKK